MKDNLLRRMIFLSTLFILFSNVLVPVSGNLVKEPLIVNRVNVVDDDFDQTIIDYMNNAHWPSIALAIIKNNSMVWSKGYGYADVKNKKEATNETVYLLASISKTFAATAIMQLWEKGLLGLDDDVNEYLPFNVRNPDYPDVPITFRMLLTHRSSLAARNDELFILISILRIPYDSMGEYFNPGGKLYSPKNWNNYPPGEQQSYSSAGFDLLGYLVECITNQSFPEYCTENIFQPLDMKNTSYHPSYYEKDQLAVQYIYLLGRYIALPYPEIRNYGSGGLRSNLEDLSHYLIAYMNGGEYNGVRILKNDTVKLIFTLQYPNSGYRGYGLGWQIFPGHNGTEDNLRIGHNGAMPGSQTYMFYHVSENVGIIMLTNDHLAYSLNNYRGWFSIVDLLIEKSHQYI
jgi:CubicO group peptidase (beta-lactamase class C family)